MPRQQERGRLVAQVSHSRGGLIMTTRIYVCRIEVDEDIHEADFSYSAALIEENIRSIEGCKVTSWDTEED